MAFESGADPVFGTREPLRFFEYGWTEDELAWCVIGHSPAAAPGADPTIQSVAKLAWPVEVSRTGTYRPYWWQLIEAPRLPGNGMVTQPDTLLLVLAPDVELMEPKSPPPGLIGDPVRVNFQIVRAPTRAGVPQRGENLRPAMLEPVRTLVRAEYDPEFYALTPDFAPQPRPEEMQQEFKPLELVGFDGTTEPGDHAIIVRKPGSCVVSHQGPSKPSWRVEVTHDPPSAPGSFAVEVIGLPRPADSLYVSHYRVRVITCGNVTVRALQAPLINTGFTPDQNPFDIHVSHVTVEHAIKTDQSVMPYDGWDIASTGGFRAIEPYSLWSGSEAATVQLAASALEMIPVVGSFIEVGGLLYAAATGRTWYGDEVTDGDLAMMGVFCVLGLLPGVSSSTLKELYDGGQSLFKGIPLISMNPGLVQQARRFVRNGPRLLRDYVYFVEPTSEAEMVALFRTGLKTGGKAALANSVAKMLEPVLRNVDMIDDIPESLLAEQMEHIAVESLPGFAGLSTSQSEQVSRLIRFAVDATDPQLLRQTLMDLGHEKLWSEFYESARDASVFRLFSSDFATIRDPGIAGELTYRSLFENYEAYVARKTRLRKKPREALEWISKVKDNALSARLMVGEFGANWRLMLKPFLDARRFEVTQQLASDFQQFASRVLSYEEFRELVSGRGFGMLFQVDHIFEQRFLKYMPEQFTAHTDDFLSFLVPWNQVVANNLIGHGVKDFLYVHSEKTALLRQLIPYGFEGLFTTQEYWYVYQYVYIHQFMFTGADNANSFFALFQDMNRARRAAGVTGETVLKKDLITDPAALFARIIAAHNRLGLKLGP